MDKNVRHSRAYERRVREVYRNRAVFASAVLLIVIGIVLVNVHISKAKQLEQERLSYLSYEAEKQGRALAADKAAHPEKYVARTIVKYEHVTIESGDTLYGILANFPYYYCGDLHDWGDEVCRLSGIKYPSSIVDGWELTIPYKVDVYLDGHESPRVY